MEKPHSGPWKVYHDLGMVHHKRAMNGLADHAVPLTMNGKVVRWGTYQGKAK